MNQIIRYLIFPVTILLIVFLMIVSPITSAKENNQKAEYITLPEPKLIGKMSLEECLAKRRSVRTYADEAITMEQVSQLLWAAQGITSDKGGRTAPSAGALYPLEIYIVVTMVKELDQGIYRYECKPKRLLKIKDGSFRKALCAAALGQKCIADAPLTIVIAAEYARTSKKYGERAERYVHMEVGNASQNIYLQAESLGLGTVAIGAFYDDKVKEILGENFAPLLLMPMGVKQ